MCNMLYNKHMQLAILEWSIRIALILKIGMAICLSGKLHQMSGFDYVRVI